MKAVVIPEPGAISVETVDDPSPDAGDVVVAVDACGICGTDLHILAGDSPLARYPLVPGHEFSGEVVAVGRGVESLRTGDVVAVDPSLFCGACRFCRVGRGNLCEHYAAIGVTQSGAAAEFVRVPAATATRMPEGMPRHWGALVEPLACVVHGLDRIAIQLGEHVLIYGAGPIGLLLVQLARRAGAASVSVVDVREGRLRGAAAAGADATATSADAVGHVHGWSVVIDATGVSAAIEDGVRRLDRGGRLLLFGVPGDEATVNLPAFRIYNDELRIVGSMAILGTFERALDLLAAGAIDAEALVTHRLALKDYGEAVDLFRSGNALKIHVTPA